VSSAEPRTDSSIGVVALVPDRWLGVWTVRHHVLHRLAQQFDVVWVEPARGWRDYWLGRFHAGESVEEIRTRRSQFTVYRPGRWRAEVYRPRFVGDWLRRQRVRDAVETLRRRGCTRIVLYVWRPQYDWALDAVDADLVCYHIDDEYSFSSVDRPNDPREVALIRAADLVIIHSQKLFEKKGSINQNSVRIPNGVDYAAFSTLQPEPADLADIPRPRMGYVGVIKVQLDLALLVGLATRRPEWSFVLVGPVGNMGGKKPLLEQLQRLPNVHLLGNKPVEQLPGYCQHFDVCMMCYEVSDYTNYIYPLKMHEYLASGRPVVSAPIEAVRPFSDVLETASGVDEWEDALLDALRPERNTDDAVLARQARAKAHDWDLLVERIAGEFRRCLRGELVTGSD